MRPVEVGAPVRLAVADGGADAVGRLQRQVAGVVQVAARRVGEHAAVPAHADLVPRHFRFRALDVGPGLLEQALAEVAARVAVLVERRVGHVAVDEVVDVVAVGVQAPAQQAARLLQRQFDVARDFLVQVRIADVERQRGVVRAARVQLVRRRRALRVRQGRAERIAFRERPQRADRAGAEIEGAFAVADRLAVDVFVAHAGVPAQRSRVPFLDEERGRGGRVRGRHGVRTARRAQCREVRVLRLHAERAVQAEVRDRLVRQLDARLERLVREQRGRHAVVQLGMVVIRVARLYARAFEAGERVLDDAVEVVAVLALVDVRAFVRRDAVEVRQVRRRQAGIAPVVDVRAADADVALARVAVRQAVGARRRVVQHAQVGDLVVVRVAHVAIDMQAELAEGAVQRAGHVSAVVDGAGARLDLARRLRLQRGRDAFVDDVDEAADGAGAVQQGGGAAQDLDLARHGAFRGDGVVVRQAGHVRRRHAVFQHLDARAFHAADDGARRAGAERGRRHAQFVLQRLAERAADLVAQFVAGQHLGRGQDLVAFAVAQRGGGDDDLLDAAFVDGLLVVGGGVESRVKGEQERAGEQRTLDLHDK